MLKKRILITMTYMHIGGAERSLLGLLDAIDYSKFEVDLFLFCHEGSYMSMIPREVNLLPEIKEYEVLTTPLNRLKSINKRAYWKKKLAVSIARFMYALKGSRCSENGVTLWCEKMLVSGLPRINNKEYDLGISFMMYHSVLSKKACCRRTAGWCHTDYSVANPLVSMDLSAWRSLDYIVHVSDDCLTEFLKVHPLLKNKACVVENILSVKQIMEQATCHTCHDELIKKDLYILSLGRLTGQKNFLRAIESCAILKLRGYHLKWLVLGDGENRKQLERAILEYGVEDRFLLLGGIVNPYPYISHCSIYVQTSDYEGKSVAIREAQIIGKPVLITNYETSRSQLKHGVDGIIVDMTAKAVAEGIIELIEKPQLRESLASACRQRDYSNANEIRKIYEFLNF